MNEIVDLINALFVTYGFKILGSIAILVIGRWVTGLLVRAARKVFERASLDAALVGFFSNLLRYGLLAIVVIAALNNVGISTTSIVAIFGAATLALGLALQDSLGNLAAGVLIILLRPYKVDDYVEIDGAEGHVTEIQLFHTLLTTLNSKSIFIPNKNVLDGQISNYSKKGILRLQLVFGIGYGDDILKAKEVLLDILKSDERVLASPAPDVVVGELGDSSVNLIARPYVNAGDKPGATVAIIEKGKLRFDEEGISIPFPQRDVHLYQTN